MASQVIALTGPAGSGKSEAAKYLAYGHGFTIVKFAGPLKAMLRGFYEAVGLDAFEIEERIEGSLKEVPCKYLAGRTPRHAMVTLGTEWGRQLMHPDLWTNAWSAAVDRTPGKVAVDDLRFPNEAVAAEAKDAVIVQMKPKVQRRKKSDHVSEKGIDPSYVNQVIKNDEGIGKLRASIDALLYPIAEVDLTPRPSTNEAVM